VGRIQRDEWDYLVAGGWTNDGSSCSLDSIFGVRIGITSTDYDAAAHLPANRHDFFYELGRACRLADEYKAAADADYRDGCAARVSLTLIGWRRSVGVSRARWRWLALRSPLSRRAWEGAPKTGLLLRHLREKPQQ
jgi:hypothetical protein